ncbi:MAG: ABC transporter transmembrane domain-containing protein, partial [Saprospiraceae bacterium]
MARRFNESDDALKPKLNRETLREGLKIFKFVSPYRGQFIWGMILLFLSTMVFMVFPSLIGVMVDIAQGEGTLDFTLGQIGWALIVVLSVQGVVSYLRVIAFANVSERGTADIRRALYERMIGLPITFFEENKTGDLISRLTADVDRLYSTFSITLAEALRQVLILIVGILFLAITTPRLSLIMVLTVPVVVVAG